MIDKLSFEQCVLCGSCRDVCPTNAISFTKPIKDFLYPSIEVQKCINCNLCEKSCPVINSEKFPVNHETQFYVGRNCDKNVRIKSSSGGLFLPLAEEILKDGGSVCGAIIDEKFEIKHCISDKIEDVLKMMGSKYAQSDLEGIYKEVEKILQTGKKVLFCGCACQIAGMKAYLKKEYEELFLVELICHGIPSNQLLKDYIGLQEKRMKSKVTNVNFRDKTRGWHNSSIKILFENNRYYSKPMVYDAFMQGYFQGITMKESCYECAFKEFKSGADIILGDFWGAEVEMPQIDDNTGLSAIIVCSHKGHSLLKKIKLDIWEIESSKILKYNKNLLVSSKKSPMRSQFYAYAEKNGYEAAINDLLWEKKTERVKREVRFCLRFLKHKILRRGDILY